MTILWRMHRFIVLCIFIYFVAWSSEYRILGIFPTQYEPNFGFAKVLMTELADRGHNVTVVSNFPLDKPRINYLDVSIAPSQYETLPEIEELKDDTRPSVFSTFRSLSDAGRMITELTINKGEVINLYMSVEGFDLVILEVAFHEALLGFGLRFRAPVIAISNIAASSWVCDLVGSPSPLSYVPSPFLDYTDSMNMRQRAWNLFTTACERLYYYYIHMPAQQKLYDGFYSKVEKPALEDLRSNVSLVLVNSHFSLRSPRPYVPNMVEVGGLHIPSRVDSLPPDLRNFIGSSKLGAIFVLTEPTQTGKRIPIFKAEILKEVFQNAEAKVIWKWKDTYYTPGKLNNNTLMKKSVRHRPILAYNKTRLFITHGNLINVMEAAHYGVPILGIPMFGDQFQNLAYAERRGFARVIDYYDLSEASLRIEIRKMLASGKYQRIAKKVSNEFREQPLLPLHTATFWIEYVARHKGAPNIRSPAQKLSFIQYFNLDVFICILIVWICFTICAIFAIILMCKWRKKQKAAQEETKKEKVMKKDEKLHKGKQKKLEKKEPQKKQQEKEKQEKQGPQKKHEKQEKSEKQEKPEKQEQQEKQKKQEPHNKEERQKKQEKEKKEEKAALEKIIKQSQKDKKAKKSIWRKICEYIRSLFRRNN